MSSPSSSRLTESEHVTSRRQLLATVGTGTIATLAGCGSLLQDSSRSLNPPEIIGEKSELSRTWNFPRGVSDEETPVQVYLDQAYPVPKDGSTDVIRFTFGATVFDYTNYHHSQIKLRLQADREVNTPPAEIFVHPLSGGFTSFRTYIDDLETVIILDNLEGAGTLEFGFLVDSGTGPYPDILDYQFEITAASDDLFAPRAVASDSGQFPIVYEDG